MTELNKNTLKAETLGEVLFCSVSEPGAMGDSGAVIFANRMGEWFSAHYYYGDVSLDDVIDAFPVLAQCRFGTFGRGSGTPFGWHYLYLGFGNHLIIHDIVYADLILKIGPGKTPPQIYGVWRKCATDILEKIRDSAEKTDKEDSFQDIREGSLVYNNTFGYGKVSGFADHSVKILFRAGVKSYRFPQAFEKKILVRASDAGSCSEPFSPISSVQIEKHNALREINTEQITLWLKKPMGRINRFKGEYDLCGTEEFPADEALRKLLFEMVTEIDRSEPWCPEYDACVDDDTGIRFTFTYTTGHCKHVNGHMDTIPYMKQIEALFRLIMIPDLENGDDITLVHGTDKPVFTYWLKDESAPWDDFFTERYAWPLQENTPGRFLSEYKKAMTERIKTERKEIFLDLLSRK